MSETSSARAAGRGAALLMVAHVALMVSGYVIAVVLARGLGPALYGAYGLVYSFLLGMELMGRLGVPQALSQRIASSQGPSRELERSGVTLTAMVYLVVFLGFWIASPLLARLFQIPGGAELFRIASLDIPFYGLYFVGDHILNGQRRFGAEARGILLYSTVRTAGILALFFWVGLSVEGALIVNVVGSVVALGYVLAIVGPSSFVPCLTHARELVRLAIPIGLFGVGSQLLLSLDLWALNFVGGVPQFTRGFYVAAGNVARIPNVVAFVMMAVLVPTMARSMAIGDSAGVRAAVRGTGRFLAVSLLPACGLIAVESASILQLMFSAQYAAGGHLLAILIFSHGLLYTVLVTACSMLIAADRAVYAAGVTLGIVPVALVADVVLINTLQAEGAALGALLSIGGSAAAAIIAVHKLVVPMEIPRGLFVTLIASLGVAGVGIAFPVGHALLIPKIILLAFLYLAVLTKLGVVGPEDLELFRSKRPDDVESVANDGEERIT